MMLSNIMKTAIISSQVSNDVNYEFQANGTDNYFDTGIVPTIDDEIRVWGNFRTVGTVIQRMGVWDDSQATSIFVYFGIDDDSRWKAGYGDSTYNTGTADTDYHKFTLNKTGFYIDDVLILSMTNASPFNLTYSMFMMGRNTSSGVSHTAYFNMDRLEIDSGASTITWEFNEGTGNTIYDDVSSSYTIQGTVLENQWQVV